MVKSQHVKCLHSVAEMKSIIECHLHRNEMLFLAYDLSTGKYVQGKQNGTQNGTLGHTRGPSSGLGKLL